MRDQEKIHQQCLSDNPKKRIKGLQQLEDNFSLLPDKQKAWEELIRLTSDLDERVSFRAFIDLGSAFSQVPDKQMAWEDLIRLTSVQEGYVRGKATYVLGSAFSHVPDKQKAWEDLIRLTSDQKGYVISEATYVLGSAFSHVPDKQKAWEDLHKLTDEQNGDIRRKAAYAIGSTFFHVPDKQKAWEDLIRLTSDQKGYVSSEATYALGSAFSHVPDKQKAWEDLHKLTDDQNGDIRGEATYALGSAFSHIPDKQKAWEDLHKLTDDQEGYVRGEAAYAIGSAFSHIPDKQKAWEDLIRLASNQESSVRIHANHSLGKVSIFQASQAGTEEEYKKELEKAIEFFERAAQESAYMVFLNPSQFCLPFYRSFHTIVFKKQAAKGEVGKYIEKAKDAIKGSKSKEILLESVENLANALKEVQNLENLDLKAKKEKLNLYRQYCDRAAELMIDSEEPAPYATAVLRKGLPIFGRNLKQLLEEIQKRTELIHEQTKGTQFEELGDELKQSTQFLSQIRDPVGLEKRVNSLQNIVRDICSKFPDRQKGEACELLKMMYVEPLIEDKLPLIENILSKLSYQLDMTTQLNRFEEKLDQKLSCISFDIFKIKLNSYNVISNLDAMKKELEKLNEIEVQNALSIDNLSSTQAEILNDLKNDLNKRLNDIEILVNELPDNQDTKKLTNLLSELKQSDSDMLLQRSSGIASIISFVVMFVQLYQQYRPV